MSAMDWYYALAATIGLYASSQAVYGVRRLVERDRSFSEAALIGALITGAIAAFTLGSLALLVFA
jgi:hypothetical protein